MFGYADLPWNNKEKDDNHPEQTSTNDAHNSGISIMANTAPAKKAIWRLLHALIYLRGSP